MRVRLQGCGRDDDRVLISLRPGWSIGSNSRTGRTEKSKSITGYDMLELMRRVAYDLIAPGRWGGERLGRGECKVRLWIGA
jgi:hypothetical protein